MHTQHTRGPQLPGVVPLDEPDVPRFKHWRWIAQINHYIAVCLIEKE
jgi:hypothetical protein